MLNKYFDRITCLCVDRRLQSRENTIIGEINKLGDQVLPFIAGYSNIPRLTYDYVDSSKCQELHYGRCFRAIVKKAKDENVKFLLFFEDDAILMDNFKKVFVPAMKETEDLHYDGIFLGGVNADTICYNIENKKHLLLMCTNYCCLHAVAIRNTMFDQIIDLSDSTADKPFDAQFIKLTEKNRMLAIQPNLVVQKNKPIENRPMITGTVKINLRKPRLIII